MRQELLHIGPYTFINDTYNANPASMAEAIRTLDLLTKGRKIAVLGGMGELGTGRNGNMKPLAVSSPRPASMPHYDG